MIFPERYCAHPKGAPPITYATFITASSVGLEKLLDFWKVEMGGPFGSFLSLFVYVTAIDGVRN
jgi:hypothetical protein